MNRAPSASQALPAADEPQSGHGLDSAGSGRAIVENVLIAPSLNDDRIRLLPLVAREIVHGYAYDDAPP